MRSVTCGHTGAGHLRGTLEDTINDLPWATVRTGSILALHTATRETLAHLLLCGVERLPLFVVYSMVTAATVGHGDALIAAEHEAVLTRAALAAPPWARDRVSTTGVLAGVGAELIGAVGRTGNICQETMGFMRNQEIPSKILEVSWNPQFSSLHT